MPQPEDNRRLEQEAIAELIGLCGLELERLPMSASWAAISATLARLAWHGRKRWGEELVPRSPPRIGRLGGLSPPRFRRPRALPRRR